MNSNLDSENGCKTKSSRLQSFVQELIQHYEQISDFRRLQATRGERLRAKSLTTILGASSVGNQSASSTHSSSLISRQQLVKPQRESLIQDNFLRVPATGSAVKESLLPIRTTSVSPAGSRASSPTIITLSAADIITEPASLENTKKILVLEETVGNLSRLLAEREQEVQELKSQIQDLKDRNRVLQQDLENSRSPLILQSPYTDELEQKYYQLQNEKEMVSADVLKLQNELKQLRKEREPALIADGNSISSSNPNKHPVMQRKLVSLQMIEELHECSATPDLPKYPYNPFVPCRPVGPKAFGPSERDNHYLPPSHRHHRQQHTGYIPTHRVPIPCIQISTTAQQFINTDNTTRTETESLPVFKEPLCLIGTGADGKPAVNDDVLNQISQIPEQLNVIAITGLYRTGKSYLLNRLPGGNKGFPLGCTIQSETKGIWAWCRHHPNKSDEVLLLLDTEGLGDIKKGDPDHDNWIFALATILSSTIVYNALGNFDQDKLEKLNFITEISNHIKMKDRRSDKGDSGEFDFFFPLFILTVRDFTLRLAIDDRNITSDEYLEECLSLRPSSSKSDDKYNELRLCIRNYFKKRACFTFDRPASRRKLQKLETLTDADLNDDFIEDSNKFTTYVFDHCPPKKLDSGQAVNGRMFANLTRTYVEAIRNGRIPCIENAMETIAQIENTKAVDVSVALYVEMMQTKVQLPVSDDTVLSDAHHMCVKEAIAVFLENAMYDRDQTYQKQANETMNVEHEKFKRKNEQASESKSQQALSQLNKVIEDKMKQQVYTRTGGHKLYQQDIMQLKEEYGKLIGLGCKKLETLFNYLESKFFEGQTILQADQLVTETERKAELERQKAIKAEKEKENADRLAKIQTQNLDDEKRQMEENIRQLTKKQEEEIKYFKEQQEAVLAQRLSEQERSLKEGYNKNIAKLEQDIDRLQRSQQPTVEHNTVCSIQ